MKLKFSKSFFGKLVKQIVGSDYNAIPIMTKIRFKIDPIDIRPPRAEPVGPRPGAPAPDPGPSPGTPQPGPEGQGDGPDCGKGGAGNGGETGGGGGDGNDR